MWRTVKLTFNLLITAVVFNYFISVLVLLLNPQILFTSKDFLLLYLNLLIFYGPLWFIFLGCAFVVIQFFSEKKYSIGVFGPPTVTYFLAFSILIITFILYLNYDYYFDFFPPEIRINLIKILLINLALIITGVVFVFFKRINKKWIQILFLVLLSYNILYSYTAIIHTNRSGAILSGNKKEEPAPRENVPRKIRVVVMDGLSLDIIYALSSEQKVLNFKEITKKGAGGRVTCYKPNLSLSLINSALTGLKPSEFTPHSNIKYKFLLIDEEFDIRPRYIFFRKSSFLKIASFYNKNDNFFLDNIARYYEANGLRTIRLIRPELPPVYGEKSLRKNSRFVQLFSDLLNKKDEKFDILKKAFFFDDYLMNCMRSHWRDNSIYYSIVRFPGLGIVGKYFYQYYQTQIGGDIPAVDIKKYGLVIEKYYEYYASIIGNLISATGDDELLVILSFYEYEPLPVWRRILVNIFDQKDIYVYKSLNSRGSVIMYEKNAVKQDYPLQEISIYDLFPTLLYYSGFPLPKNLEGEVVRETFTDDFVLNNPIDIDINYKPFSH